MRWRLGISEKTKAVLWLWVNDQQNWRVGNYAVVHEPTGVAVWTGNKRYGISLYYDIPNRDRLNAHPCSGKKVKLGYWDRRALFAVVVQNKDDFVSETIQKQISDWAAFKIRNNVGENAYQRS
jgi:hypothetical protein